MKARMNIDIAEFNAKSAEFRAMFMASVPIVMRSVASQIKAYAKANAPWEDDTGNARQGLQDMTKISDSEIEIVLYHTMEYGFWLELAHQRRYKILEQSIRAKVPDMVEAIRGLF